MSNPIVTIQMESRKKKHTDPPMGSEMDNEAENEEHELFGEQRMMDALHGRKGAYAHLQRVEELVHEFVGDAEQSDDLTMLFIHYLGKEPENHRLNLIMHNNINQITRLEGWLEAISAKLDFDPALIPA